MAFKAIQLYLASDVASSITTTASGVWLANTDIWTSPVLVPSYAYKSLAEIFVGILTTTTQMQNRIVYKVGANLEQSQGEITLLGDQIESVDYRNEGLQSNEVGAETMTLDIVLRLPEEKQDWDRIINADLRIRYLLDENWRKKRRGVSAYIPNLGDSTISSNVRLRWQRHLAPPNAKEIWSRYFVNYTRAVPKL